MLKLISEAVEDVEFITEAKDNGKKSYKIRGVFMQSDVKIEMDEYILKKFLQKKLPNMIKPLLRKIVLLES